MSGIRVINAVATAHLGVNDVAEGRASKTTAFPSSSLGTREWGERSTRPPGARSFLIDLHQLDVENEVAFHWAGASVGQVLGNPESAFFAFDHELQAFGPTRDDAIQPESDRLMLDI